MQVFSRIVTRTYLPAFSFCFSSMGQSGRYQSLVDTSGRITYPGAIILAAKAIYLYCCTLLIDTHAMRPDVDCVVCMYDEQKEEGKQGNGQLG